MSTDNQPPPITERTKERIVKQARRLEKIARRNYLTEYADGYRDLLAVLDLERAQATIGTDRE